MALVATVGNAELDGVGGRDEIERVVARFARHGVLARFHHVTFHASAAHAGGGMVRVIGNRAVLRADRLFRTMADKAQGIVVGRLNGHRTVARAVRIVAGRALKPRVVHDALEKRVTLHAVLVGRAVVPKLGRLLPRLGHRTTPEFRELHPRLVAHGPGILGPRRPARQVAGEADVDRPIATQPGRVDDVIRQRLVRMGLARAMATLAADVPLGPTLRVVIRPGAVATVTQFENRPAPPVLVVRIPPVALAPVRQPGLLFHAPLGRKHDLVAVDPTDVPLLPPAADHVRHVFEFEGAMGTGLAEIGENGPVGTFANRRLNHLDVQRVLPAVMVLLVTLAAFRRSNVPALIDASPSGRTRLTLLRPTLVDNTDRDDSRRQTTHAASENGLHHKALGKRFILLPTSPDSIRLGSITKLFRMGRSPRGGGHSNPFRVPRSVDPPPVGHFLAGEMDWQVKWKREGGSRT